MTKWFGESMREDTTVNEPAGKEVLISSEFLRTDGASCGWIFFIHRSTENK